MRVFHGGNTGWSYKVNFVDNLNVFVGYDMGQQCCEHADWYISPLKLTSTEVPEPQQPSDEELEAYFFDKDFFEEEDELVIFKLVCISKPDLYLHLFNVHNGYYAHGFSMSVGGIEIRNGYL